MDITRLSDIAKHFSCRSKQYDTFGTWVNNDSILSSITEFLPKSSKNILKIIDLGAGTGAVSKYIIKAYPLDKSITTVDICADMLSKILDFRIKKCVASLDTIPFVNDTFDVAVSRQCLHYVDPLGQTVKEIKRVLRKDGSFILSQIVPIESQTREYWSRLIRFRQPLRKHFFSEADWINTFTNEGFTALSVERFSHRASVMMWVNKYNICDLAMIDEYKRLLLQAPEQFIEEYNVSQNGDDVNYDSFWFVANFSNI